MREPFGSGVRRVLVTGGAGFIGSHFAVSLLRGSYPAIGTPDVTVIDKLTYAGSRASLAEVEGHDGFRFVHGDIRDAGLLSRVVPGHDMVLNFAAETHVDRSISADGAFVDTNVGGTRALLEAALDAGVSRFVQISTDEVYGSIETGAWTEDSPVAPNSPYAAAKAGGDLLALAYHRTHGLPVIVTRCSNNYGARQFPEKIIPLFVTNLLEGLPVPLYGDGTNEREWLHVADHRRGIEVAAVYGEPGRVYHIAGGTPLTNLQLTERLLDACGAGWDMVRWVADRPGHDRRYALDDSRLRALGYEPRTPFDVGLEATVRWYADNPAWWRPLKAKLPTRL